MKKLIIILMFAGSVATAQTKEFCDLLITDMNGVIEQEYEKDGYVTQIAKLPSFYDLELVIMTVSSRVNEFTDIEYIQTWKVSKTAGYDCGLVVSGAVLFISYVPDNQNLWFIFQKK